MSADLHEPTDETETLLHVLTESGYLATYTVGKRTSPPRVATESGRTYRPPLIYSNRSFNASTESASPPGGGARPTAEPSDSVLGAWPASGAAQPPTPAAPRASWSPDARDALRWHGVRGENIWVSPDGSVARRVESSSGGVVFSARPVKVNEKVCIRFVELSSRWSGVIRFGFTTHDPTTLSHALPKTACPDLTNKPGNWAKALGEMFCEKDNILYYYVNSSGDVHFGVNGEDKGLFFSGVDTRSPLWALVDVYGNCTAVQFTKPRAPSQYRRTNQSPVEDEPLSSGVQTLPLPQLRYKSPLIPLSLHRTKGRNVQFINDKGVVARNEAEFCQGYVFTSRPMRPGQTIVVQILSTDSACASSLAIGLTSCDPATLNPCDLPDDAEQLLNRPEYWVVRRDVASGLGRGDELAVTLTLDGEVRVSRNGSNPVTVMRVDHTVRLWAFVDINGASQKVRILSSPTAHMPSQQFRVLAGSAQNINASEGTVPGDSLPPQNCTEPIPSNQLSSASQNERMSDDSTSTTSQSATGEGQLSGTECVICYDNPKDCVLSECGHLCMCYNCAVRQWMGEDGRCPICRAEIRNVIRAYMV